MNDTNEDRGPARPPQADNSASAEMPRYQCHKKVHALKILGVRQAPADQERMHVDGDWYLDVEAPYSPVCVGHDFITRHMPTVGGYYVVYDDGYASFSPAKAFEDGYTRI